MSLDLYLEVPAAPGQIVSRAIFIRENGATIEVSRAEWDKKFPGREPVCAEIEEDGQVWWRNITHNLTKMADAAGIYKCLWHPDEIGITQARDMIAPLEAGLKLLRSDPARFKELNPPNKWGDYDGLVAFADDCLTACKSNPDALVRASV